MTEGIEGSVLPLPIDPQIIAQQAQSTIKSIVDAVVELLTNSDDSYRRLEQSQRPAGGDISLHVVRSKGGSCSLLEIQDHAEGMDWPSLERAITFAASSSGFFEGRTVRGLFGRGLKEAIVGLGMGTIRTVSDSRESVVDIFTDGRTPKYRIVRRERPVDEGSGTQISIEVLSQKIKSPKFDVLYRQVSNHFALRDILQNNHRFVQLRLDDTGISRTRPVVFDTPSGTKALEQPLKVEGFGAATLTIFEATERLDFTAGDPSSVAGILVRTESAIVDHRLFGFEAEDAAHYFFGHVDCPGIAAVLRDGDLGVLDPNRSGLDWRHQYCRALDSAVKDAFRPLVYAKREALESRTGPKVKNEYRQKLNDLCKLLNALVESELEDLPDWGTTGTEITTLVVRPEVGYAEPNQPRNFGVYVPERLLVDADIAASVVVELVDTKGNISLSHDALDLQPDRRHEGLLSAKFTMSGKSYGDRAYVLVRVGRMEDMAELKVQAPGQTKRKRLGGTNRGLFRDIDFDTTPNPIQRVSFVDGTIKVYLRFPPILNYIKAGGQGMDTPQGSLMLAELVAEGFCRTVARRQLDAGLAPSVEGGEIDAFNSQVNLLMRRHLGAIHDILVS
jgi:hypothetical protein